MAKLLVCLLLFVAAVSGKHEMYEGHQLYLVRGPTQEIAALETELDVLSAKPATKSSSGQLEALVRLSPEDRQKWLSNFDEKNMSYTIILDDLAALLRQQDASNTRAKKAAVHRNREGDSLEASPESSEEGSNGSDQSESNSSDQSESNSSDQSEGNSSDQSEGSGSDENESNGSDDNESNSSDEDSSNGSDESEEGPTFTWDAYYNAEEINDFIDEIGRKHADVAVVINAGLSYEGRQIKYLRISTTNFQDLRKPVIIIEAAAHAREWITPPVALYIVQQLVDRADNLLLDQIDWIIIPLVNPDGYEYSRNVDRLWRKTRSRSHAGSDACPGIDINRNFDHHWGTTPGFAVPCAITYEGPTPFSESETRVVRDAVNQHSSRAMLYLSVHSFGNMFLYAWGNNGTLPANGLSLHLAGVEMAQAIDALALEEADRYIVGNAANVLYFTTGTSRDWTRSIGIPLTYTVELPGYTYGFLVPPTYLKQIVTETWAGIVAGGYHVLSMLN